MTPTRLDELVAEIGAWQDATFCPDGEYRGAGIVAHLRKEIEELAANPRDMEEVADCVLLLIHLARQNGGGLEAAVRRKHEINKARRWGKPGPDGSIEHIREAGE